MTTTHTDTETAEETVDLAMAEETQERCTAEQARQITGIKQAQQSLAEGKGEAFDSVFRELRARTSRAK